MKKLFLLICMLILSFTSLYSQTVNIPFVFTDGMDTTRLYLGLDSTATDSIDPHLGESQIPPIPPTDILDVRFDLSPFINGWITTWKDYRYAGFFPYVGIKQHRLMWQINSTSSGLTIIYNFPEGTAATVQDLFGGVLINKVLIDSGSYTIPHIVITSVKLTMYYNTPVPGSEPIFNITPSSLYFGGIPIGEVSTRQVQVTNGGNSIPLYISNIISSNSSYTISPNIFPINIPPQSTKTFDITLTATPGSEYATIQFIHNAPGSPYILNVSNHIMPPESKAVIRIESGNHLGLLWFGLDSLATDGIDALLGEAALPPLGPPGMFDYRLFLPQDNFSGTIGSYKDFRYGIIPFTGQKEFRLAFQPNSTNTITIKWFLPAGITGTLQDIINGTIIYVPISDTGSFVVPDPAAINRLRMLIDFDLHTPVDLVSFNAVQSGSSVHLKWITGSETNNHGFEIERLKDYSIERLNNWERIGFVEGNGTTTETHSYSYNDENISEGKIKYRLKQIDFDGSFIYSNEVVVDFKITPEKFILYQNYPNPFNPGTSIKFSVPKQTQLKINLYNVLGEFIQTIAEGLFEGGSHQITFNAENLPSGIYIYRMESVESTQSKMMILLK